MANLRKRSMAMVMVAAALALLWWSESVVAEGLSLEIFVAEPEEINVTSALIMGPTEMMVMSAQGTRSAALRLADLIESKGLALKYVFLSHPHLDHSQGAGILLERFPEARFIATPEVAALQRHRIPLDDKMATSRYGTNAAVPSLPAEDYLADTIEIDGYPIEIWKDIIGDAGIGHPDEPHVALHIPALNALLPSDVVYYNAHVMLGGTTEESRRIWLEQLNSWLAMDLSVVVPGHMPKGADLSPNGALTHTRDYILAYDRAMARHDNADAVIKLMLEQYPNTPHRSALLLGTYLNFSQMHRLTFNPKVEKVASWLPRSLVEWADRKLFEQRKKAYNNLAEE
ncbi:MBL fold metallo-hydrolase [Aliagarivorans marinus]|uniref:MBL fold metallo-hydrolase n=1 Tax=Aliagarivorans marinus TaxID=561965 RepID=UPI0004190B19|nr:MBL fold metallo-hydrolase [Aliagarivorans marinus]